MQACGPACPNCRFMRGGPLQACEPLRAYGLTTLARPTFFLVELRADPTDQALIVTPSKNFKTILNTVQYKI